MSVEASHIDGLEGVNSCPHLTRVAAENSKFDSSPFDWIVSVDVVGKGQASIYRQELVEARLVRRAVFLDQISKRIKLEIFVHEIWSP